MIKKMWFGAMILFIFTLILTACGTESGNPDEPEDNDTEEPADDDGVSGGISEDGMLPQIEQLDDDLYRYSVTNENDEAMTFEFTSGQRFDFALFNDSGEQEFLMSSVSSFIQALGEETVAPGEQLSYEFEIPPLDDLEAGTYTLQAWLTPSDGADYLVETQHVKEN